MDDILARISGWLAREAPTSWGTLQPPADPDELARLSGTLGWSPHPELVALLRWHDGGGGLADALNLAPSFLFMGCEEIARAWVMRAEVAAETNDTSWDRAFVPFATDLGAGYLVVDHRPGPTYGQVFLSRPVPSLKGGFTWPSLSAMLGELERALTEGAPMSGARAFIVDGELDWEDVD